MKEDMKSHLRKSCEMEAMISTVAKRQDIHPAQDDVSSLTVPHTCERGDGNELHRAGRAREELRDGHVRVRVMRPGE
jgi:hypothetical protein